MAEKREAIRLKKRMSLRFGLQEPTRLAFTEDLSDTGMFIKTANICQPGTVIRVELSLGNHKVQLETKVIWAKKVPPQLIHLVQKSGMGVRILRVIDGEEAFEHYCTDLAALRP